MPKETSTQRKRRLAKAKLKRKQRLANESFEDRERRLLKSRLLYKRKYSKTHVENDICTQKYGLEPMSLLRVRAETNYKEVQTFCDQKSKVCTKRISK